MLQIKKLSLGVRSGKSMFRFDSMWGVLADAIIGACGKKPLVEADYFQTVGLAPGGSGSLSGVSLKNEQLGHTLSITMHDVLFTKHTYHREGAVNADNFFAEFAAVWNIINPILRVDNIRRIGIVAEHRIYKVKDPSARLLTTLTKYPLKDFPAKFVWQFERRVPTSGADAPNHADDDFYNFIHAFYDSANDGDEPEDGAINANLDVQRYFAPMLSKGVLDQTKAIRAKFDQKWRGFQEELQELKLVP